MRKCLILIKLFMLPTMVLAEGTSNSKIKGYVLSNSGGFYITPDVVISNTASCNHTNRFVVDTNTAFGKLVVSSVLAAYHSGKELRLVGDGTCNSGMSPNSESLRKICTKDGPC
ncbi:hypothetical protein [Aliikangiella maris]|uniref:Uncharacterized protein n=2 Tax=Aliikangiella maris TaxID=3162458 RepID=A0ABV2C086_9GAMM